MLRRSRRHGRNTKKATSSKGTAATKLKQAAIKRVDNKVQKKKPGPRGRGRWKRSTKKTTVDLSKNNNMKQQNTVDEESEHVTVKEEIMDEQPDVEDATNEEKTTIAEPEIEEHSRNDVPAVGAERSAETTPDGEVHCDEDTVQEDEDVNNNHILVVDDGNDPLMYESKTDDSEVNLPAQSSPPSCSPCKKDLESSMQVKPHGGSNQIHRCMVCSKVLSSASSLDRHMLVHSGERPFKCKLCDMAFTTNGNMHRHMRTHGEPLADVADVCKGVDLRKREAVKRKLSLDSTGPRENSPPPSDQEKLNCPVCGKSLLCKYGLQLHMETHPNDPILCQSCGEISLNYSVHINHKCNILEKKKESYESSCCGFRDLNFMDFSTNKFSLVSKFYCEQNVKRPSSAFHVFECLECKKAFPCGRALKLHMNSHGSKSGTFCASCDCSFEGPAFLQLHQLKHRSAEHCHCPETADGAPVPNPVNVPVARAGKEDFLALFNLQTKESQLSLLKGLKACRVKEGNFENSDYFVHGKMKPKSVPPASESEDNSSTGNNSSSAGNNDFADIQSILSLTSKAPLITDVHSSPGSVRPMSPMALLPSQQPESPQEADLANSSPETPSVNSAVHADSVPEIVPVIVNNIYSCKICNQKFRTINTLKRHSKMHIQRGSNYSCHLCSYISVDKSTLIRHLRTHNGERPFQCIICKYAFTTKANCERHVRKRHKKMTKPEIRNCMQYNENMALKMPDLSPSEISNSETVCKYCNVDFKFNRVLRHHLRSLHNSCNRKPFSCKICSFGFSTKNNCIRHVLKQHPSMKDKLRSVVIPNSKLNIKVSETESDNTTDTNTTSSSTASRPVQAEQTEPLNLNCRLEEQPLNLSAEEPSPGNSTQNEAVIAAESLVSLSETLPPQEEPLDLAIHPLDLSCKSEPLIASVSRAATPAVGAKTTSLLDLSAAAVAAASSNYTPKQICPKTPTNIVCLDVVESPSVETGPVPPKPTYAKVDESPRAFGQKYRAFTCVYCSAGFTLKSNMERHIKRKHPEYARPTRSRNFIPAVIAHRSQRTNIAMLSDKTRDALRHVLNTKVQHGVPVTKEYTTQTVATNLCSTSKEPGYVNAYTISISPLSNLPIVKGSKEPSAQTSDEPENLVTKPSSVCGDDNSTDLASVSSVICMANSQQFNQYFDKPTPEKKDAEQEEEEPAPQKNDSDTSVSCPFCSRKFPWSSSLRRHILTHTGQKPYKCPRCALWFTTKSNCERHLIRKHGHKGDLIYRSVPDRPYKCNQCPSSTFSTQGNLRKHFYLKHWTKSSMGMYTKVTTKKLSEESVDSAVEEDTCRSRISISQSNEEHSYSQTEKKRSYECQFCFQKFRDIAYFSKHMLQKHKHVIYMCYLCRKTFPSSDSCYSHFKTSHSLVYLQIAHNDIDTDVSGLNESSGDECSTPKKDESTTAMACMVCFQKISSLEHLQRHIKKHLQTVKANADSTENPPATSGPSSDVQKTGDGEVVEKRARPKNKVQNSLLYFFTPRSASASPTGKVPEVKGEGSPAEEGSDLIQNLLGIHDSRIIDEMLVSADSAARLLGVKEV